ncbi:phosphoribosyltransferase [Nocardia amamiensis]|uniref:phosphoribosyltransferase n=1 Tax=Nocardia amamiensis TaxID=404578 RepID=UPI00082E8064|nr:phosphoribosyltransferase family protein [Nocardia amamiensis]
MSSTGTAEVALDLTWPALEHHTGAMADRIRADGVPEVIVGILRGGMVPAVMLAHHLGVRDVRGVEVTHTLSDTPNGAKSAIPQIANPASLGALAPGTDVLLVDDVAGSGDTVEHAARLLPDAGRLRRAIVVVNTVNWYAAHPDSVAPEHVQDYIGCTCAGWVRFPWEVR